jgi:hypothetical protein
VHPLCYKVIFSSLTVSLFPVPAIQEDLQRIS